MIRKTLIFLLVAAMPLTVFSKATAIFKGSWGLGPSAPWVLHEAPVHPRSAAMAHATTALRGASETMFDNPANLAMMDRSYDVTLAHREWIADILFYQGSIALRPAGGRYGTFGLTFWREDFGEEEFVFIADNDSGYISELFHMYCQSIGLGYALSPIRSLSVGGHVRYMKEHFLPEKYPERHSYIMDIDNDLIAYDLGLSYRTGLRSLLIGLVCRNYWRNAEEQELAYVVEAGAAMDLLDLVPLNLHRHSLVVALDRVYTRGGDKQLEIGAEYAFSEMVFIRAGYRGPVDPPERNLGAGLRVPLGRVSLQLDYARGHVDHFGDVNRFAIQLLY